MTEREPLSTEPYKGVHDYYPEDWARVSAVFDTIRQTLRAYGFEEYQASPLERAELYESKTSEEIVNEQTFTFTDRGDRRVTLRPEMTPTLARMVAAKRRELIYPLRWFSIGNRFRYERMQKGRSREFYQADVDLIGLPGPKSAGEIIVMASELLKAFGATDADFTIKVNSRELLNKAMKAAGLSEEETLLYIGLVDRKNKMSADAFEEARAPFRKEGHDPLEIIEQHTDAEVEASLTEFMGFIEALHARGMTNVEFDPTTMRGFLYYTGIVFEIFDTDPENARAILGGGGYDGLIALFGGEPIPAMGFALGIETLIDFLTTHTLIPKVSSAPTIFIGTPTEADIPAAQAYADTLRAHGLSVLVNVLDKPLGDQVKEAVKRGIPYFLAYGANEAANACVRVKTLAESREEEVTENIVAQHILAKERA